MTASLSVLDLRFGQGDSQGWTFMILDCAPAPSLGDRSIFEPQNQGWNRAWKDMVLDERVCKEA